MREHLEECKKFPVKCSFGCDKSDIPRGELKEHSKVCPRAPVPCNFSFVGCTFHDCRESLEEHFRSRATEHLTLMAKFHEKAQEETKNFQQQLKASQELIKTYEARLALQTEALALNKQTLSTHQVKLARVEENVDSQRKNMDELRKSVEALINAKDSKHANDEVMRRINFQDERLALLADEVVRFGATGARVRPGNLEPGDNDHRFGNVEHSIALHEIKLADQDLKLQIMETTCYDGCFLWKIDNFQRRFRESVEGKTISIYSPPFYTSRYGYKLCARAYLNGDGPMGKGKYLSLFIVLMRGEYDALLTWPFQHKVTMKLVDQERLSHITEIFRPDPNSSSFQRPRSEMNIASGCPLFCSHSLLRSRGYVRDDTMFIKIIVEGNGIAMI